jgi:hypothetical protein
MTIRRGIDGARIANVRGIVSLSNDTLHRMKAGYTLPK